MTIYTEILKLPSEGLKNMGDTGSRSCQLISHTSLKGVSVKDLRTIFCVKSMVKGPQPRPMKNRPDFTQAVHQLAARKQQEGRPNPYIPKHLIPTTYNWSQSSSSSSTWWTPQEWQEQVQELLFKNERILSDCFKEFRSHVGM